MLKRATKTKDGADLFESRLDRDNLSRAYTETQGKFSGESAAGKLPSAIGKTGGNPETGWWRAAARRTRRRWIG